MKIKYEDLKLAFTYLEKHCAFQPLEIELSNVDGQLLIKSFNLSGGEITIFLPNENKSIHVTISEKRWLENVLK